MPSLRSSHYRDQTLLPGTGSSSQGGLWGHLTQKPEPEPRAGVRERSTCPPCLGEQWASTGGLSPDWSPACNTDCPTALPSNSGCRSLTPWGPSAGLPSARVLRKLVSGPSLALISWKRGGTAVREHRDRAQLYRGGQAAFTTTLQPGQGEGVSRGVSVPHSKDSLRLLPLEARAGSGHTTTWTSGNDLCTRRDWFHCALDVPPSHRRQHGVAERAWL